MPRPFSVRTAHLDLPPLVAAFSRRLHEAGLPVEPERAARLARALGLVAPVARRRLYWTARAVLVSDRTQAAVFDTVFAEVFGSGRAAPELPAGDTREVALPAGEEGAVERPEPRDPDAPPEPAPAGSAPAGSAPAADEAGAAAEQEVAVPVLASAEEALRAKRFDALEPDELRHIYQLMEALVLATPQRRTRRAQRRRHGRHVDVRRTLRTSLHTGGDPVRLARRQRRMVQRRLVLLCDISGSMEPYARAYLQFLSCAALAGGRSEAFVFATRLTRVTRALHARRPDRAIAQAAAAAPDWSSGTRIGDALTRFTDRHGRRGMARGAVIVILSDGWERGDPERVGREMQRLSRLAHRIVWVNPRVAAPGFSPRTGGMAAALPYCDALVSGHSLAALHEVVAAIGAPDGTLVAPAQRWPATAHPAAATEDEAWASATPVPGSSVAMPSGYGPSRGRTTPGWVLH